MYYMGFKIAIICVLSTRGNVSIFQKSQLLNSLPIFGVGKVE